jgi:hypothetical protein
MLPPDPRDPLEIRCPRCGGRATWEEPFAFVAPRDVAPEERERLVRWGNRLVREKFPSVIRWTKPERGQGHAYRQRGVVRCHACHAVVLHRLDWPEDALFRWSVRGVTLYAWDEEHARVLLDYIGATLRDPNRYGERYRKGCSGSPARRWTATRAKGSRGRSRRRCGPRPRDGAAAARRAARHGMTHQAG